MQKLIGILVLAGIVCLNIGTTGCKKVIEVRKDSVIIRHTDTVIIKHTDTVIVIQYVDSMESVKTMLTGKWLVISGEVETYSGGNLIDRKFEYYSNPNTYIEYKQDMTYNALLLGSPNGNGLWELLSPYYLALNKGVVGQERYYYILKLDSKILITHGPFNADGTLYNNLLYTFYYSR